MSEERLDDQTEQLLNDVSAHGAANFKNRYVLQDALRRRIRALVNEARKAGVLAEEIALNGSTRGMSL